MTDDLELHIIELPKLYDKDLLKANSKLIQWLYFLENPNSKEVLNYMKKNSSMKEAKDKLDSMSDDREIRRMAELREKWLLDQKAIERTGYNRGFNNGVKDGIKQGIEQGIEQGSKNSKYEIAKKMKIEKLNIKLISKITGLSEKEIEEIKV